MMRIFNGLAAAFLMAGCAVDRGIYPESWAKQVKIDGNECPFIDGQYKNAGERFRLEAPVSLAYRLHNHATRRNADTMTLVGIVSSMNPAAEDFESVELKLDSEYLRVSAVHADGSRKSFSLNVRARCQDSTLLLKSAIGFGSVYVASSYERYSLALGRAGDGSLLLREVETTAAFLLYYPVLGFSEAEWYRFPAVTTPAQRL